MKKREVNYEGEEMANRCKRAAKTIAVFLLLAMTLSGCKENAKVTEKPAVQTENKTSKKQEKKAQEKKTQKPSEALEDAEEYEEVVEEVVEKEGQQTSASKDEKSSASATSQPEEYEEETSEELTCYLSIYCDTILDNMDKLEPGKEVLVPTDGTIFAEREVSFQKGETVFDVLLRETRNNGIHMEYSFTPGFNSNYVEGIANLYEMDCGPNSGWMFNVNGWYPNYGCSLYKLEDQDVIEWNYTCHLGRDL